MLSHSRSRLRYWGGVLSGRRAAQNLAHERYLRISRTLFSALVSRGVGFTVNFISVPLTVGYLGAERYGLWITISTLLGWFALADLGLANTLTNNLSTALAQGHKELAQQYVATTFWLLVGVATVAALLFFALWLRMDWNDLFSVHGNLARRELAPAIAVAAFFVLAALPLLVNGRVFYACQEGSLSNYWTAAGNVASLLLILLVVHFQLGLIWLIVAVSGTVFAVSLLSGGWLFAIHRPALWPAPRAINRGLIRHLGVAGGQFFVVQIAVLLIFQSDNLIITHFLGAAQVTPYAVCFKLFSYATLLQSLISPALWPAYAEAMARSDDTWVRRTFRLTTSINLLLATLVVVPLIFVGRRVIAAWAGPAAIPPQALLYWMALWIFMSSAMNSVACLLNGAGRIKGQTIYGSLTALTSVTLACALVRPFGVVGVAAGTVLAFFFFNCLPACLETAYLLRRLVRAVPPDVPAQTLAS